MISSLGWFLAGSAAFAVAASVVGFVRLRVRAATKRRRHVDFAERFKQSGFVEYPAWDELETHPMQLHPPT